MTRKITARDVALAAGVSSATVDRVLNGRGGVSPEKERKVLEWARRLKIDRNIALRASRTLRIAVLIQPPANPFHAKVQAEFVAANLGQGAYNMQFLIYHIDPQSEARIARKIREVCAGHDALILAASQNAEIAAACREFARKGPVITLATDIHGSDRLAYVGPDNVQAGRVAGDLMGRFLQPLGGEIIVIAGMLSMQGQQERHDGFRAVLSEHYPECRIVEVAESYEEGMRAGDAVRAALKRTPGIRGVYNASSGARPVVDVLRGLDRSDVVFVTHELTEERRALLRAGWIDAIIDQNPEAEVSAAIQTLAAAFGRAELSPEQRSPMIQIHMIENC